MPVSEQSNHRGHPVRMRRGVHFDVMQFFGLRHALQHQYHRAPYRCYVDRLVRGVQHQHRLLHQRHAAGRYWRWESTAGGTLGAGHSRSTCIGGMAPPGIDHAWPPCAHRASLGYDPTEDVRRRSLKPRGPLSTRSPIWRLPRDTSPAPEVITSSTSKTRKLSTWLPGRVAKAPRTDSQRSSRVSRCFSGRGRMRVSRTDLYGRPRRFARGLAMRAAWL